MKRFILVALIAIVAPITSYAAGTEVHLDPVRIDIKEKDSLVRGAHIFTAYCLSCHSASYMRYNRMAKDLDLAPDYVKKNMMFAADKIGDLMIANMNKDEAKSWFGIVPPDLTLTARSRSPEWIYTYLRSFYYDTTSVSGWNNTLFPHVAMPHVLHELQGTKILAPKDSHSESAGEGHGSESTTASQFETLVAGKMSDAEYDSAMRDLTNFMVYLSEPAKLQRHKYGPWVILFLVLFAGLAYLLKKEYWRDVH